MIRVIEPGLFTTVQDLGREGFGPMGVSASARRMRCRCGWELLVGIMQRAAAGLEMTSGRRDI